MGSEKTIASIIQTLFEGEPTKAKLSIGPIYSTNHLLIDINDEGHFSICLEADGESQFEFAISDFCQARVLADALGAWADQAERRFRADEEELRRRRREMGLA